MLNHISSMIKLVDWEGGIRNVLHYLYLSIVIEFMNDLSLANNYTDQ